MKIRGRKKLRPFWAKEGGEESAEDGWLNTMPESFRSAPFISKAETPEAALEAINNAASHMGNSIRIPSQDAGTEDMSKFHENLMAKVPGLMQKPKDGDAEGYLGIFKTMGTPDQADAYKYVVPEGKEPPSDIEQIKEMAFKNNLTQTQFQGFMNEIMGVEWANQDEVSAGYTAEKAKLGEEWGMAYDNNISTLKNFLNNMKAPESVIKSMEDGTMSAAESIWMLGLAKATANPGQLDNLAPHSDPSKLSPVAARDTIQEMLNNHKHAYWNAADPRHKEAVNRMIELQHMASPDTAIDVKKLKVF